MLYRVSDFISDGILVKVDGLIEFMGSAMLHKMVGHTHTMDAHIEVVMVLHVFGHCTAKSSVAYSVLYSEDMLEAHGYIMKDCCVYGFEEPHVVVTYVDTFRSEHFHGFRACVAQRADGEQGCIVSVGEQLSLAYGQRLQRAAPLGKYSVAPGIADDKRSGLWQLCCVHEAA